MDDMLFSFLEKKIHPGQNPSPKYSRLPSQNSLIRAIEVKTSPPFGTPTAATNSFMQSPNP
jgi:hypothetical protein